MCNLELIFLINKILKMIIERIVFNIIYNIIDVLKLIICFLCGMLLLLGLSVV